MFKVPELYRLCFEEIQNLGYPNEGDEQNGVFLLPGIQGSKLFCIASNGLGWEHVSISKRNKRKVKSCPSWEEMCYVKNLFWGEEDTVLQFHPPKNMNVNVHNYCLHLWRPLGKIIELPPSIMV